MYQTRRKFIAYGIGVSLSANSGCLGVIDSDDEDNSNDENSTDDESESVERFRVVVEYSGTWRGDIRYFEDGNTLTRVPFAGLANDPDRLEVVIPDDLENPNEVGSIKSPTFTTTDISGADGPSEENPFVVTLYVEGEEVDTDTITEGEADASVEY